MCHRIAVEVTQDHVAHGPVVVGTAGRICALTGIRQQGIGRAPVGFARGARDEPLLLEAGHDAREARQTRVGARGKRRQAQPAEVGFVQRFEQRELECREAAIGELAIERGGKQLQQCPQARDGDALVVREVVRENIHVPIVTNLQVQVKVAMVTGTTKFRRRTADTEHANRKR